MEELDVDNRFHSTLKIGVVRRTFLLLRLQLSPLITALRIGISVSSIHALTTP